MADWWVGLGGGFGGLPTPLVVLCAGGMASSLLLLLAVGLWPFCILLFIIALTARVCSF